MVVALARKCGLALGMVLVLDMVLSLALDMVCLLGMELELGSELFFLNIVIIAIILYLSPFNITYIIIF